MALAGGDVAKIKMYLANYKKKYAKAVSDGEVDDQSSERMSAAIYRYLCLAALREGDTFMWSWLTQQWNLMCRGVNVADLRLEHLSVDQDAFIEEFKITKSGQGGEQTHPKHVYACPLTPSVCAITSIAMYFMRNRHRIPGDTKLYQGKNYIHTYAGAHTHTGGGGTQRHVINSISHECL